jgi:hypothetical protein
LRLKTAHRAWANKDINVVTVVAWAGVGKSTLVNHWLRRMAAERYRSAQLVFGWSFYRQGSSEESSSTDEFLDAALNWFGDRNPLADHEDTSALRRDLEQLSSDAAAQLKRARNRRRRVLRPA